MSDALHALDLQDKNSVLARSKRMCCLLLWPSAKTAKTSSYLVMQPKPAFHEVKNEKGLKVASEYGGRMQG